MKFELTNNIKIWNEIELKQIRALIDIPKYGINVGDLGGWIEKDSNLSQEGSCWIFDNANAYGKSLISEDAYVYANAQIFDNAIISGTSIIGGSARVFKKAKVSGDSVVVGVSSIKHNLNNYVPFNIDIKPYEISYSGFEIVNEKHVHYITVGCEDHIIENWMNEKYRTNIITKYKFPNDMINVYLEKLTAIYDSVNSKKHP